VDGGLKLATKLGRKKNFARLAQQKGARPERIGYHPDAKGTSKGKQKKGDLKSGQAVRRPMGTVNQDPKTPWKKESQLAD